MMLIFVNSIIDAAVAHREISRRPGGPVRPRTWISYHSDRRWNRVRTPIKLSCNTSVSQLRSGHLIIIYSCLLYKRAQLVYYKNSKN